MKNKSYLSLFLWILSITAMGYIIGSLTKTEISTWYSMLNRSSLTPPNYVFPIVWTSLYIMIGIVGYLIWNTPSFNRLKLIKSVYIIQLLFNWSWTPVFFGYHLIGFALLILAVMDGLVAILIGLAYPKIRSVSLLLIPYLLWIVLATYLNVYIWQHN